MPLKGDRKREYDREWARKNRASQTKYNQSLRKKVLIFLGGKCVKCGCTDLDALEINHINGGGAKELKKCRKMYYLDILSGRRPSKDLNIMCRVCNSWHYLVKLKGLEDGWEIVYKKRPCVSGMVTEAA